ncbi:MAG TPA: maltose ABC transporter permease MalF [Kofleriaceae bacterium]|nr:maltose ABC transporter permease MalF [Kofleriaceae bacterium]
MQPRYRRIGSRIAVVLAALVALVSVYQLYLGGNLALAAACTAGFGLAFYVFTARRTYTYRYLFPGLAGIAMFTVLPLAYTVWIGFTNYSSKNLLTFERATEVVLGEVYERSSVRYQFTLRAAEHGFRIVLRTGGDDEAEAGAGSGSGSAARPPTEFITEALALTNTAPQRVAVVPLGGIDPGEPLPLKDVIARRDAIRAVTVLFPDGTAATMASLREFTPYQALYQRNPDGSLTNRQTGGRLTPNFQTGFYETATGDQIQPGFRVYVGADNYVRVFTDGKFRGPFLRVFVWTVVFAAASVIFTAGLGMLLAELLAWESLRFAGLYRVLLFLPYAVPSFISILVFKGLFNRNFGEINLILDGLLGLRPNWTGNALLARGMILIVNTWLGYPYFMLICTGLQKSISHDLYEASALAGAGPLTNFFQITWPLIRKPLTPLLVSSFAFNFNNFVIIYLLTQGRPDFLDTNVPAGETDILVSYTYRIAFEDSGQQFGLASTISTLIFIMIAILSVINLRMTRSNVEDRR